KILKKDADKHEARWDALFERYEKAHPILAAEWKAWHSGALPEGLEDDASLFDFGGASAMATRAASGEVLNKLAAKMPNIIGGSADLGPSNKSVLKGKEYIKPGDFSGQNIHYGVREFAMAAIANGIALHGGLRTYVATFLVFTDYLKAALRSAAMMRLPVIFIATHDSIGMGEDGPTHQPVEHLAMMRAMPGCTVIRPADANETAAAYLAALRRKGPTVLALARQDVPVLSGTGKGLLKGGYVLRDCKDPDIVLLATGSEVKLICDAADVLAEKGVKARVVSLPCFEIFDEQDEPYRESVLGKGVKRLAVEAATSFGWHKYVGDSGDIIALDHFGASAPSKILFEKFGFTVENVVERAIRLIGR
ncbi:MAG: transketolase C-terminal domain-containing protein, partial [Bacillota bacterium]|nr:transketolase C-terminal domain-containing protein [Bacillota bacterium]